MFIMGVEVMYENLNEELIKARENIQMKNKLNNMLDKIKQDMEDKQKSLELLKKTLAKEEDDVKRLEGVSMASIFYSMLGNKSEHLDKEQKEFLEAKLKYEDCNQQLSYLKEEKLSVERKIRALGTPEDDYETLLEKKEDAIMHMDKEKADKLTELAKVQVKIHHDMKEVQEAIAAGNEALDALSQMVDSLESAENWGTWDMFGGGTLATMIKHSKIDEAKDHASEVQHCLNRFNRELSDVMQISRMDLDVNITGFETFADYFWDGLISDWMVQNKINNSLGNAQQALTAVEDMTSRLNDELTGLQYKLDDVMRARKELIAEE